MNVGTVAAGLSSLLPERVRRRLPPNASLATAVHDIGKVSPGFLLKYFRDTVVARLAPGLAMGTTFCDRHARIGAATIDRWLQTETLGSDLAMAVAAHHGSVDRGYPPDLAETYGGAPWADERRKLVARLCSVLKGDLRDAVPCDARLLAGLTCVADWIGSDEEFFPSDAEPSCGGDADAMALRALEQCGFRPLALRPCLSFRDVFGFEPRPAQTAFLDSVQGPGLYVLEAPMGIGKTEAALYAAYRLMASGHHHGLYFALPTRLTSDRIHTRVAAFLQRVAAGPTAPLLAHGMAWLRAFEHGGEGLAPGSPWFHPMKRALLHPVAVGTIDQALLAVLNVKHAFVRLFGLAGKVVVLDEVHSYDVYTGTLLDELVRRLREVGCTVIVLSATLTGKRRRQLAPALGAQRAAAYPLLTGEPEDSPAFARALPAPVGRACRVRFVDWEAQAVARAAVDAAQRGACVVCIANTVAQAQTWYKAAKNGMREGDFPVGILHARFPLLRREQLEADWLARLGADSAARPNGCVLVATQILEQSVDIDADWMISELAPTDMLLQRMGRLWRHGRAVRPVPEPEIAIVSADPSGSKSPEEAIRALGKANSFVYAPYVLLRTREVWQCRDAATLPDDIRALIEATYAERDEASGGILDGFRRELEQRANQLRRHALGAQSLALPTQPDGEDAPTRFSDLPTATVLLLDAVEDESPWGDAATVRLPDGTRRPLARSRPDFDATRALHRSTVSVARYLLPERGDVRTPARWLDKHFHEIPVILVRDPATGRLRCHGGPPTGLAYSDEYGVWRTDDPDSTHAASPDSDDLTEDVPFDPATRDW